VVPPADCRLDANCHRKIYRKKFFVFSDDSLGISLLAGATAIAAGVATGSAAVAAAVYAAGEGSTDVFFSGRNRSGTFQVPYPSAPSQGIVVPRYAVIDTVDWSRSKDIKAIHENGQFFLAGTVESGEPADQGFYYGLIEMWFDAADIDVRSFNPSPPKRFMNKQGVWVIVYDV
jgi:hypothetical protein